MEVKPGYKQTEVGVIPGDWDVKSLGELGDFSKGSGIRKDEVQSGDLPCIRYGEIYTHHNDIVRKYNSRISAGVAKTAKRLRKGDVLFSGSGETKQEIGKAVAFVSDDEAYAGGDIVIVSPRDSSSEFLGYALNAPFVVQQKASKGQGDAVVHINANALASIKLPVPPFAEKCAIANALSDMDALLEGLDRLTDKKRAIKQAAMQQLLTGQIRLPGFSGEWEIRRLEDALAINYGKSQKDVEANDGVYPILATGGQIGLASQPIYEKPTVLIGRKGTINQPQYMDKPFWSVDTLFYSEMKDGGIAKFFYYRFCLIDWMQYNEASGVPSLNAKTIEGIECAFPDPEEQAAIATVLSDMDAEITILETRRTKTRALKQAMMQELLTGRTRLI